MVDLAGDGRHEANVDRPTDEVLKRGAHLLAELVLQPFARECVRYTDEEDIVLFGDHLGVLEPGVVGGSRQSDLELTKCGGP